MLPLYSRLIEVPLIKSPSFSINIPVGTYSKRVPKTVADNILLQCEYDQDYIFKTKVLTND